MRYLSLITVFILLVSCNKDSAEKNGEVYVRIENASSTNFDEINVADVYYGNTTPNTTSDYKLISQPVYAAACLATINERGNVLIGAGACGSFLPPPFEAGKYTFKITASADYDSGYSLELIKE